MAPLSEPPGALSELGSGQDQPEIRVEPPGPLSRTLAERLERVECPAFGRRQRGRADQDEVESDPLPIVLASGRGSNLYDVDGNRYVDLAAGFGSVLLGHGSTAVAAPA